MLNYDFLAHFMISRFLVLCTVINLYFAQGGCFVFLCVIMHIMHHACSALQLENRVSKEEIYFKGR